MSDLNFPPPQHRPANAPSTTGAAALAAVVMVLAGVILAVSVAPATTIETSGVTVKAVETTNWTLLSVWLVGAVLSLVIGSVGKALGGQR